MNVEQIDKQWEGVNELLLQITTFFIVNATSLLIAVFAITWTKGGTVFNRTLVLHYQETIGSLEANLIKNDNPVQILQVTSVKKYKTLELKFQLCLDLPSDCLSKYTANAYRQTTDKLMFKSVISTVR